DRAGIDADRESGRGQETDTEQGANLQRLQAEGAAHETPARLATAATARLEQVIKITYRHFYHLLSRVGRMAQGHGSSRRGRGPAGGRGGGGAGRVRGGTPGPPGLGRANRPTATW